MTYCRPLPSLATLHELLIYDSETGHLFWKVDRGRFGNRTKAGWPAGSLNKATGYFSVTLDGVSYKAHRIMWKMYYGTDPLGEIDHWSLDKGDNSITNLRDATISQNRANRKKFHHNKSGYKGVSLTRYNRWVASIKHNKQTIHLGTYSTPLEAHQAYCAAAAEIHSEFARF